MGKLWKCVTDGYPIEGKPESLISKQCVYKEDGGRNFPCLIIQGSFDTFSDGKPRCKIIKLWTDGKTSKRMYVLLNNIYWLDEFDDFK